MTAGEEMLTSYQFNKKHIDHVFCSACGTQPIARGIAGDAAGYAMVNARCLDDLDTSTLKRNHYNGKDG